MKTGSNAETKPQWEERTCVVVSTAHCQQYVANGDLFTGDESWRMYGMSDHHVQYYLGSDLELLKEANKNERLYPLLKAVVEAGFVEIRFDADGPELDGFPILFGVVWEQGNKQ